MKRLIKIEIYKNLERGSRKIDNIIKEVTFTNDYATVKELKNLLSSEFFDASNFEKVKDEVWLGDKPNQLGDDEKITAKEFMVIYCLYIKKKESVPVN